ncbi:MAG: enoyl-CoA hydratase/isomerase family protein [Kineosporiaceae bacterium]
MTGAPREGGIPPADLLDRAAAAGLRLSLAGRRVDVVLDHPQRRNAQTPAMWRALAAAGAWAAAVADIVFVGAEGPSFSAGLDRRAFAPGGLPGQPSLPDLARLTPAELDATISSYQAGFTVWSRGPFVSVAAVQGHAVGAGFQLALACDVRIAAEDARFAMREPALGLVPDLGGTAALVTAVGYARAVDICATARWVDAAEAERIGLVQAVVPTPALPEAVDAFADAVLANPGPAVRATRGLLRGALGASQHDQLAAERLAQGERLRALLGEAAGGG